MASETREARIAGRLGIVLVCAALAFTGLSSPGAAARQEGSSVRIRLVNPPGESGLERLNPRTHIYEYGDERAWIQLSFERRPFEDPDAMGAIRESFEYCNVEIRFPERATDGSRVYAQLRGPLRDLDARRSFQNMKDLELSFAGYEQGRLRGVLRGSITRLTTERRDLRAISGDIAGVARHDEEVEIPFLVEFDLSVD